MADVTVKSLGRNSAFVALAQVWRIGSRVVLTPLILGKIGLEGYGTWVLLFSLCNYVSMFSTTANLAYAKFTAEYDRKREYERLSGLISTGIVILGGFGALVLGIIWLAHEPIFRLLKVPEHLMSDSGTALSLITAAVLLRLTVGCVFKILEGLQRMDLGYKMTILGSAFEFVVAIALLSAGYGLVGLAIAYLCGELLATSVGWVLCHRLCPMLHLSPFLLTRDTFRELGSLAARFQVSSLLATGYGNGLKAVMSGLFGTSMLAAYELADKLFNLARVLSAAGFTPLMPAFANLHQAEDPGKWRSLYTIGSKAVAVVAVISLSTLVVFADQAILVWTGEEYDLVAWIIRAMFVAHFMNILTGVGTSSLRAQGSMRLEILFRINAIVLTVITAVPGTLLGGFKGFIMAFAFSFFTASAWFVIAQSRQLGPDFVRELRRLVIRSSAVGGSLILGGLLLRPLLDQLGPAWPPRWHAVFEVAVWGPLFSAIGLLALLRAIFSTEERRYLLQKICSPAFRRRSLG